MCAGGVQVCITCALARCALRVAATTTSSCSSTVELPSARHCLATATALAAAAAAIIGHCAADAVGMRLLCSSAHACPLPIMPVGRLWTTCLIAAQLLAAEVTSGKWQIQEWTFATVSAAAAQSVILRLLLCCVMSDDRLELRDQIISRAVSMC